jgi:hypothetical protein
MTMNFKALLYTTCYTYYYKFKVLENILQELHIMVQLIHLFVIKH